jgi:sRNA-binding carbon storage regulator CsrA
MVLGIEAPKHMPIIRHEIPKRKREGIKEKALKYSKEEYNAGI